MEVNNPGNKSDCFHGVRLGTDVRANYDLQRELQDLPSNWRIELASPAVLSSRRERAREILAQT